MSWIFLKTKQEYILTVTNLFIDLFNDSPIFNQAIEALIKYI